MGPGDNIGLLASKTSATSIRGQYYGIAAATGKIGAFSAIWLFVPIVHSGKGGDNSTSANQNLFWVASSLCVLALLLAWFFLPEVGQDTIDLEDRRFRAFLQENGYDTAKMGLPGYVAPGGSESPEYSGSDVKGVDMKYE